MNLFAKFQRMFAKISFIYGFGGNGGKPTPGPSLKGREKGCGTLETLETPVLFRFGPKSGGFLVQKRNETPETPGTLETLDVDAGIAFL